MELNIWNLAFLALLFLGVGINLGKHGEPKQGKYNFWVALLGAGMYLFILYKGGFF